MMSFHILPLKPGEVVTLKVGKYKDQKGSIMHTLPVIGAYIVQVETGENAVAFPVDLKVSHRSSSRKC